MEKKIGNYEEREGWGKEGYLYTSERCIFISQDNQKIGLCIDYTQYQIFPPVLPQYREKVLPTRQYHAKNDTQC